MSRMRMRDALLGAVFVVLAGPAAAQDQAVTRGQEIVDKLCAACHATNKTAASPIDKAPPFRELKKRYPIENLAEALAEGIVTGHNDMPVFQFEPEDVEAILAYLDAIGSP